MINSSLELLVYLVRLRLILGVRFWPVWNSTRQYALFEVEIEMTKRTLYVPNDGEAYGGSNISSY
jgi:hypothetical protein